MSGIRLKYSSIEMYPLEAARILELLNPFANRLSDLLPVYESCWNSFFPTLVNGWNNAVWSFPGVEVDFSLYYGDALNWSCEKSEDDVDAWFLDGHSPEKNPEIWSLPIMKAVYRNTAAGGTLASFTASGMVKSALREAGFFIKRKKGFGTKRHMIQGLKS
jgi:tRNA U34 5-methylaminomethyl-2-thiouridine-forming methyltransferase MnmC